MKIGQPEAGQFELYDQIVPSYILDRSNEYALSIGGKRTYSPFIKSGDLLTRSDSFPVPLWQLTEFAMDLAGFSWTDVKMRVLVGHLGSLHADTGSNDVRLGIEGTGSEWWAERGPLNEQYGQNGIQRRKGDVIAFSNNCPRSMRMQHATRSESPAMRVGYTVRFIL